MTDRREQTTPPPVTQEDPDSSLLVEHWTDPARKERYQYYAREKYEFYKQARELTFKASIEYGKWLLASGLVVHGGALYGINSLRDGSRPELMAGLLQAALWNVAGIIFVLGAGFMTWLNFQFAAAVYDDWANPLMVYKTDQFPEDLPSKTDPIAASRLLATGLGFLALWALVASASNVFRALADG